MSKFGDKFLDMFQLNNDDYDEDYEEDGRRSYKRKSRAEDYDEEEDRRTRDKASKSKSNSKVVPMRTGRSGMEVCVIKPTSVEESREVTDTLLSGRAVILNLEGLHVEIAQRIVDFTSGSCYAVNGNLQKVSNYIFIITPENVDISGDFQDLLTSGGFDVASFNK